MAQATTCPGCGLLSPSSGAALPGGYHASAECHRTFCALTAYTVGLQDRAFIHQHAIDAYAAQHVGGGMKPIAAAFALIGLYHAIERGFDGRQVQRVHTLLARRRHGWKGLEPPDTSSYALTVCDVLQEPPGVQRDDMLRRWMRDVWNGWGHAHDWVRDTSRALLE